MEEAYAFLAEQCCINVGIPAGEPEPGMGGYSAINGGMFCCDAAEASVLFGAEAEGLTDEQLQYHLVTLLKSVNLDVSCQCCQPCFVVVTCFTCIGIAQSCKPGHILVASQSLSSSGVIFHQEMCCQNAGVDRETHQEGAREAAGRGPCQEEATHPGKGTFVEGASESRSDALSEYHNICLFAHMMYCTLRVPK